MKFLFFAAFTMWITVSKGLPVFTNSIGMVFIRIPPLVGSGHLEGGHTNVFWMAITEVTQAQWRAVMGNNPSYHKGKKYPVECISWCQATQFCNKLSDIEGDHYRLPTEAEWCYACDAGKSNVGTNELQGMAWTLEMAWRPDGTFRRRATTMPVGILKPNAWGLYDMHGNVAEWCSDILPAEPKLRIVKGGGFGYFLKDSLASKRMLYPGGDPEFGYASSFIGFRLTCDVKE